MKKSLLLILIITIILLPTCLAQKGHLTLLAVTSDEHGVTADLYLEIIPGSGRVFIDTFPFTKLDTQLSTRLGRDIACNFLDIDCSNYDFLYTIRAESPIIGGPSAGISIAALTVALLDDLEVDESVSMTGTINAGGFVGTVAGVKEKIEAAKGQGIKKVLIPKGTRFVTEENLHYDGIILSENISKGYVDDVYIENETNETKNITLDLFQYGRGIGIEVIEVSSLYEVMEELTGEEYELLEGNIEPDEWYTNTMRSVAIELCNRTAVFKSQINHTMINNSDYLMALNLSKQATEAFNSSDYYATASFCFGANIKYNYLYLLETNTTKEDFIKIINELNKSVVETENKLNEKEINSLTNFQTYIVVKERVIETENILDDLFELNESEINWTNDSNSLLYTLSYATERYYSAYAWSDFFDATNDEIGLNKEILQDSCIRKLSEIDEHYNYLSLISMIPFDNIQEEIDQANQEYENEDYIMCLFKASKAKAEMDMVISSLGLEQDKLLDVVDGRLKLANSLILKQQQKGTFPILGYSYFEYANVLKNSDLSSSLIYSHYALELGNLDLYFEEKEVRSFIELKTSTTITFIVGLILGIIVTAFIHKGYSNLYLKKK